jgi:hypothetical protein
MRMERLSARSARGLRMPNGNPRSQDPIELLRSWLSRGQESRKNSSEAIQVCPDSGERLERRQGEQVKLPLNRKVPLQLSSALLLAVSGILP